jgi:hypothetical protein
MKVKPMVTVLGSFPQQKKALIFKNRYTISFEEKSNGQGEVLLKIN